MKHVEVFFNNLVRLSFREIAIAGLILLVFIIIDKIVIDKILRLVARLVKRTNNKLDDNIVKAISRPLKFFIVGIGIYFLLKSINIDIMPSDMLSSSKYLKILIVVTICMFLYNLTLENSILHYGTADIRGDNKVVFPFVAIVMRVLIIIVAIVTVAHEFGLTGFLTGLGISGIVVAFAAQDTCSNLFGGMMIVLDKPFALGDWVKTQEVEGIVEEITFRSTRIRTFCKSLVTVPNSKLTNNNIVNYTKRNKWQITFKLTIDLDSTAEEIEKIIDGIKQIINSKEQVEKEMIIVNFTEISLNGYEIFVYFYTEMVSFFRHQEIREEINIAIVSVLNHYEVRLSRGTLIDVKKGEIVKNLNAQNKN
ncbi:MAG: mechanosensitive ion channel family protein [Sarcina sp.]